jgi:hypothetical protein
MSVDNTLLMQEVEDIRDNGKSNANWLIECQVMVNETQWIKPFKVELYHLSRDYANTEQFSDRRMVQFLMQQGDYQYDIFSNRDNLLLELVYTPLKEGSNTVDPSKQAEIKRYRGVLMNDANNTITNKESLVSSREALNQLSMISVAIQLIEEAPYRVSMMTYGTSFRQATGMMAIEEVLASTMGDASIQDIKRVLGIEIAEGYNTEIRTYIDFPDGIRIRDIPHHIQEKEGGVYPTGLGCYLQDQYWWIYPLYDSTRYKKNSRVLKLINVPNDRFQGAEKTYKVDDQSVTVLATGDVKSLDRSLAENLRQGNGLRFGDVTKLFTAFGKSKDNKALVDRATNLYEVSSGLLEAGLNNIQWAKDRATSNPYKQYSEMTRRKGMPIKVQWYNGDADLLYPGMPVKYITASNNSVEVYTGVLLGVDEQRAQQDSNAEATCHVGIVTLGVFINRKEGDPVIDYTAPVPN